MSKSSDSLVVDRVRKQTQAITDEDLQRLVEMGKSLSELRSQVQKVTIRRLDPALPIEQIYVGDENVRKTELDVGIDDLAASIQQFGLINPVVVLGEEVSVAGRVHGEGGEAK